MKEVCSRVKDSHPEGSDDVHVPVCITMHSGALFCSIRCMYASCILLRNMTYNSAHINACILVKKAIFKSLYVH